jgi:hypothetical protein
MRNFLHIKDNVVFAYNESLVEITGENVVEVDSDPSSYLGKRYVNGQFLDSENINYISIDSNSIAVAKNTTLFSSDIVEGKDIVVESLDSVDIGMTWDGQNFYQMSPTLPAVNQELIDEQIRQRDAWAQQLKNEEVIFTEE